MKVYDEYNTNDRDRNYLIDPFNQMYCLLYDIRDGFLIHLRSPET